MKIIYQKSVLTFHHLMVSSRNRYDFIGKPSELIHNSTMDIDRGSKYIKKFRAGVQWSMMEPQNFISKINVILEIENGHLV